ncbi:MAG: metallophosphoesterase [Candidatus Hermodarchaeota archaeon]
MSQKSELRNKKESAILVNPNLGHPKFLEIDAKLKKRTFQVNLLFVSDKRDPIYFGDFIKNRLKILPILDYKWHSQLLIKREREKKKGILTRIKFFFRKKSEEISEFITEQLYSNTQRRLDLLKSRIYRGTPIIPNILQVNPVSTVPINDIDYVLDEYCSPQDYLIKNYVFERLDVFFKVVIEFTITEELLELFAIRNFIMFDIVQENNGIKERTNYHSLVISKNDWQNFKFIQATDLHLAQRNDRIYGIIKEWLDTFKFENLELIEKEYEKDVKTKKREEQAPLFKLPLKKRFINPNNQFRIFIKLMNRKIFRNELDFVVLSGDLIDFTLLSKLPKDIKKFVDFDYDFSNWKIFKKIILNLPQKKRPGIIKGEELLCPVFTIPGNHDYRPYHYDIRWAGLYRKLGLKLEEALAVNDRLVALPISAIVKSIRALRGYWAEINPLCDYSIRLGHNNFIFLNTGSDSFKNFMDFITGHPSLTGLTTKQIHYLQNLTNYKIQKKTDNCFLLLHGPPINPKGKRSFIKRLSNKLSGKILVKIDEFKESFLNKVGMKKDSAVRIDGKFNVKTGTVSTNWSTLVQFCKDYCILTLAGHTHSLKEFRLTDPKGIKTKVFDAPPFSFKKVENPAAVFYDIYSELFTSSKDIEKAGSFVVQTPALGLGGYRNPELAGAFREMVIKDGKLESFKVKFIDR